MMKNDDDGDALPYTFIILDMIKVFYLWGQSRQTVELDLIVWNYLNIFWRKFNVLVITISEVKSGKITWPVSLKPTRIFG